MRTQRFKLIAPAAEILRSGGLVAFPTETVWGLGADARSEAAVERIFWAKGRPANNPLIVHLADRDQWRLAARELTPVAEKILEAFAPGPVTVVLPKHDSICQLATAGLDTVGIRIPAAEVARELLRAAAIPIAAPSANRSGRPSATTWQAVCEDLEGRIDAVLTVDVPHVGLESSVIDCTGDAPLLLRPGAVSFDDIRKLYPDAQQLSTAAGHTSAASSRSPGLQHPHYQPRAAVHLFFEKLDVEQLRVCHGDSLQGLAYCGLDPPPPELDLLAQAYFKSIEDYARGFYEFLRVADRAGASCICVQCAEGAGMAAALRDRQQRAAAGTK